MVFIRGLQITDLLQLDRDCCAILRPALVLAFIVWNGHREGPASGSPAHGSGADVLRGRECSRSHFWAKRNTSAAGRRAETYYATSTSRSGSGFAGVIRGYFCRAVHGSLCFPRTPISRPILIHCSIARTFRSSCMSLYLCWSPLFRPRWPWPPLTVDGAYRLELHGLQRATSQGCAPTIHENAGT